MQRVYPLQKSICKELLTSATLENMNINSVLNEITIDYIL